ncbi:hypothetical protein D7294_11675 [Streptomyces hoynatensis]|uniref:Uncharacterized protein n=1 Tax=Streptomyces hoynatensis TaxID=1141874 RepID=A0A3A9Z550_9ACTN|nr:hypothetical protein D7294_11675 [Streptomyces hoynatensis]
MGAAGVPPGERGDQRRLGRRLHLHRRRARLLRGDRGAGLGGRHRTRGGAGRGDRLHLAPPRQGQGAGRRRRLTGAGAVRRGGPHRSPPAGSRRGAGGRTAAGRR